MGHLQELKREYRALAERMRASQVGMPEPRDPSAWEGWREILEILYTPEEAAIASRLPVRPASIDALARRVDLSAAELQPKLEAMCDRGVVLDLPRDGKPTLYMLAPPVVGFFEFSMMRAHDGIPKKRMAEALHAYTLGDDTFMREVFGAQTVIGRALVHEDALDDEAEVLDWERATSLVEQARTRAVSLCYCRHKASHLGEACDAPQEICLSLNGGADFITRRGFGRPIGQSEAMEILHAAREHGLAQIADNVQHQPAYICNCCGCCCGQLQGINRGHLAAVNPSGFIADVHPQGCSGCSRCARACPISAITMAPRRADGVRKNAMVAQIDEKACIGCGVCATTCRKDAMHMVRRAERPSVPHDSIERYVLMALERGHLADLLCDAGSGAGSRMLNRVLRVLNGLPGAQRLLASKQVGSRFVRFVMGRSRK